ncbi:PKD domain-containing protein [Gaoshiqia sediminis]|uniref:PKD domain-containing protein n=1 Tax=Gaoshiqia sediminis TaxID=2986998 RepID=A0AA41Y4V7_9BACT|nr:PKD domain-containing protein [Gaoshiqia sediminis]MCW0481959.1 PKD domain-containing protein [Gaoshiqia sediminis]
MKKLLLTFVLIILVMVFSFGQSDALKIESTYTAPIDYCSSPVVFGEGVSITGDKITGGLKISITNYIPGEDVLQFTSAGRISARWVAASGTLFLEGEASAAEYQQAVQQIRYVNLLAVPTRTDRHIAVTLTDVDYLPSTGHFYQFVEKLDITWTEARAEAETKSYYGLKGYLATILSKEENDFIWTKVNGVGWIGATDEAVEGEWRWATGPEAGTLFWKGNYPSGQRVNNLFSFWSNGEPNNSYPDLNGGLGEDYGHINQNPDQPEKSWNDLRNSGDGPTSQYYRPQGYIIEYGGMEDDPDVSLSAAFDIAIRTILFDGPADQTICQFDTVRLNHEFEGLYEWSPAIGLDDAFSPNPKASPMVTTTYKVTGTNGTCVESAFFTVNVKPAPVVDLGDTRNICAGTSVKLDAGNQLAYEWNTGYDGQMLEVDAPGIYRVRVMNAHPCYASDEVEVFVHQYPKIDLTATDTLYCDSMNGRLQVETDKGTIKWEADNFGLDIVSPEAAVSDVSTDTYGSYKTHVTVTDDYGCSTADSLMLHFYKTPDATFSIDSAACYGYNLDVHYLGDATGSALFYWYFSDSIYAEGVGITELTVNLGFDNQQNRLLGLRVSEHGCTSEIASEHIKVVPNLKIVADQTEGCEPFLVKFSGETSEPIDHFTWDFGDDTFDETPSPEHIYEDDGLYDVGLRVVSTEGCENFGLIEEMITVRPIPSVETNIDPSRCYPHELEIQYTGDGLMDDRYFWDLSALDADEIVQDPGNTSGPLVVSLQNKPQSTVGLRVVSSYGCASETKAFSFKRKPWVMLAADETAGCAPLAVRFSAEQLDEVDELHYRWNFGEGDELAGENEAIYTYVLPNRENPVFVTVTSGKTGCEDMVWLAEPIRVHPEPVAAFQPDLTEKLITDPLFRFTNLSEGGTDYFWDFGDDAGFSEEFQPEYRYGSIGWFTVQLVAQNEYLCADTATYDLLVAPDRLFAPTGFNPNSENPENHVFLLSSEAVHDNGYRMQIFDRWGGLVFESTSKEKGWDGKMKNGVFAPAGTYVWVLSYQDVVEKPHKQTGTVTLVL